MESDQAFGAPYTDLKCYTFGLGGYLALHNALPPGAAATCNETLVCSGRLCRRWLALPSESLRRN